MANGAFALVSSPQVLHEYRRVAAELASRYPGVDITGILDLLTIHSEIVEDRVLPRGVSRDPDDDKFLACAAIVGAVLVSGDKDLLTADDALGVRVVTPRAFMSLLAAERS